MQILIRANNNLETAVSTVESVTEFTTFDLVLLVPSVQQSAVLYSWISPANTRFAERALQRDASFDEEGRFAYSARIFPVMTAGMSSQQTTGVALCSFRIGSVFSPIIKIPVDKSILPEQTEFIETDLQNLQGQIDALNLGIATQNEAETGAINNKYMTPLRTKQAIEAIVDFTPYDTHIEDASIHFTQQNISITASQISDLPDLGTINAHIASTSNPHQVTAGQINAEPANANIQAHIADSTLHFTQANISITESQISDLGTYEPANSNIQTHISATNNPHSVTATQLGVYTTAEADTAIGNAIAALVGSAPTTLDTLNELAAALGDDPNFATTVTNAIAGKSDIGHTHIKADITDFAHTHAIADVTGLQNELDTISNTLGDIDTILSSVLGV